MSYSDLDLSVQDGRPVELYEFRRGSNYYRFTTSAEKIYKSGASFSPTYIKRNEITETDDINQGGLTVTFSIQNAFAGEYMAYAPEDVTTLAVYRAHYDDPDSEFSVVWKGRVLSAKASEKEVELECESVFSSIKRVGLRARFELNCRHPLYSSECSMSMSSYRTNGSVTGESGLMVTVGAAAAQSDGYYTGGIIENASGDYRFIISHAGTTLKLSRSFSSSINGQEIAIYPGCDRAKATCINKFNNLPNFGGFPYIPTDNPFDGSVT